MAGSAGVGVGRIVAIAGEIGSRRDSPSSLQIGGSEDSGLEADRTASRNSGFDPGVNWELGVAFRVETGRDPSRGDLVIKSC